MNQKFKIQLAAIAAAFSSSAWTTIQAQQPAAFRTPPIVTAPMMTDSSGDGTLFGAVQPAVRPNNHDPNTMPPIISPNAIQVAPPIVSSTQANSFRQAEAELPVITPVPVAQPAQSGGMLAPLKNRSPKLFGNGRAETAPANSRPPVGEQSSIVTQATMDSQAESNQAVVPVQWQTAPSHQNGNLNNGMSSAGVPYYSGPAPKMRAAGFAQPRQESVMQSSPSDAMIAPPIISGDSTMVTPIQPAMPSYESGYVDPSFAQPQMAPRGYDSSMTLDNNYSPAPVPTYFNATPGEAPAMSGCVDCNGGGSVQGANGVVSGCSSCGPNGCFDQSQIDSRMGYFGAMSKARRYYELDLLYMTRTDGDIVLSNFGGVGSFDGGVGWRGTIGERRDATQGYELSYFGTAPIDSAVNRTDAAGRLSALFSASTFFTNAEAAPFFNAQVQNERKESYLHSIEFNRVNWGWDVIKSFVGFRYIYVDDSYNMFSQREFAPTFTSPGRIESGNYDLKARNNLVGMHVGRELFYDVGYRLSFSGLAKAGAYANINEFEATATNGATTFVNNKDHNVTLATSLELNLTGHYQLNRRARLRVGYQGLMLDNVASVSDNLSGALSPFLGSNSGDSDTMYFHGINLGFEFYR